MTEEKREIQVIPELKAVPAEELLDTTYAPSGTLIDGLMGHGIYILAGAPKVGKSWMVLWLANDYGVLYRSGKRDGKGRRVYLREIHGDCVANVGNEAISDDEAGSENTYNSYNTVTDGPEGA